jgi:hypothetical protein
MEDHITTKLNGLPVDVALTFHDRAGATHRLLAAGPYLRCLDHSGSISRANVTAALAAVSQKRTCERMRDLKGLPAELAAYLADQTARHAARLDAALGSGPHNARSRARWHSLGWRAAPTLAAAYQAAGIEAGVAFLALRRHLDPDDVPAAVDDPSSPIGLAMRKSGRSDKVELLDLGFRPTVTDDFPYEPFTR